MKAKIERLDDTGRGIAYINNKVTFVPKTVVGDLVDIKIISEHKNFNEGIINNILEESLDRIEAKCPYFNTCGGCSLQNISYEQTCKYKKDKVTNLFKRNGFNGDLQFISNPKPYNYRNKITLKVIDKKVGYYESKSHKLLEIDNCIIASDVINTVIPLIKEWQIKNGEVVIRCNLNNEVLVAIKSEDKISIDVDKIKNKLKLVGIVINDKLFYGESYLYEVINGLVYRISYDSFFQVNPYVASKIFGLVKENIDNNDKVLELYSGVGTLSLSAAQKDASVVGVEIVPNAVLNAIFNARINHKENVKFLLNDATDAVKKINFSFNKVIVDPPRSGLTKAVIEMILNYNPEEVFYISCDMHTLVRDVKLLSEKYHIKKLYAFDMFSYTYHVETFCVLKRK